MLLRCPFPSCNHAAEFITNNHCETTHNLTKTQIIDTYGKPERLAVDAVALKENRYKHHRTNIFASRDGSREKMQSVMGKYYK